MITKEMRRKVMMIANYLFHKCGYVQSNAMRTAWRLVKTDNIETRVAGVTFENRQRILHKVAVCYPDVAVQLCREKSNEYDANAVAVYAVVHSKYRAKIGYLPAKVAAVVATLLDKGMNVATSRFRIVGGLDPEYPTYGARLMLSLGEETA